MKLFQRLLVAPAALGLMAPVAANADTAFSSTTSLSGGAVFTVGSVSSGTENTPEDEEMSMVFGYSLDMTSSFTGEDELYVGMEAGNNDGALSVVDSATGNGTSIEVHSVFYTFPVGDLSITAGPLFDQDDVVAATTSAHSESFVIGSAPYSKSGEGGAGFGVSYSSDSGLSASVSYVGTGAASSSEGFNSDTATDVTTFSVGYDGDGFGGGVILTSADDDVVDAGHDSLGLGFYYSPESIPATLSVAYDSTEPTSSNSNPDATYLFVGVDYELGVGTLSTAFFSSEKDDDSDDTDSSGYEVSYSYPVNDYVTASAGFFSVEEDTSTEDDTGVIFETAFSF